MTSFNDDDLSRYAGLEAAELIAAVHDEHPGRVAAVSSFGAEAAVLLHMVAAVAPAMPVMFLDTGKHFWQTRYYRAKLVDRLGLRDVRIIAPDAGQVGLRDPAGTLSATDPDACCEVRKVRPLERALSGFDAVLSGRKRYHGGNRETLQSVSRDAKGRLKAEPLANFDATQVDAYFVRYDLPRHPLVNHGFFSIGCMDCTARSRDRQDPRAGRWAGQDKLECGIHLSPDGQFVRSGTSGV